MIFSGLVTRAKKRAPDIVIHDYHGNPYLRRWYLIPRNPVFNVYLHNFVGSDDDRALHDHPWVSLSLCLSGHLREFTRDPYLISAAGTTIKLASRPDHVREGDWRFRWPKSAHRIELVRESAWTLFITGPRLRVWGFHCPQGWVPHTQFGERGCD